MNIFRTRKIKYSHAKAYAKKRGIPWHFNYPTWWRIWCESGLWEMRGIKRDQYVMARFGDEGPYASWNVRICLSGENVSEAQLGKIRSSAHCLKISKRMTGNKNWTHMRRNENGQFDAHNPTDVLSNCS